MTATAPTTASAVPTTGRGARRGRIRRIIVGSLLTGTVLAAVLTLIVFAGAAEPVITGSALLGFAAGWALLAALSARMTDQPQGWARAGARTRPPRRTGCRPPPTCTPC